MKESTLIEMQKKIDSYQRIIQFLYKELEELKDISYGTLELIKLMPSYKKSLEKLKEKHKASQDNVEQQMD